jgi:hypothetical protein
MAKVTGLGDNLYVGGYQVSNDTSGLSRIGGGPTALDFTGIDKSAYERLGGLRTGEISFTGFFNPTAGGLHTALSSLPTADVIATYARGTAIGDNCAMCNGKSIDYGVTRSNDGMVQISCTVMSDGFGLEWGQNLTSGLRVDTAATNGTGLDTLASASFGGQAYLQVTAFSGTDVTVKIQDSADNATFADVATFAFTQITTTTPQAQRIATSNTATLRRYLRASTVTTGGFTSLTFHVGVVKNALAGQVF